MNGRHRFHRAGGPRPWVLGHRGARAFEPENTIAAFRRALDDGADGVELDVRMTSDAQLVISHDDDVRFEGHPKPLCLSRLTADQVRHLNPVGGQPIPTLRDALVFQAETGCLMNVELKADVPAPGWLAEAAARAIALHGGDGIVISSFSPHIVWRMARLLPHVPVALLLDWEYRRAKDWAPLSLLRASGFHPHHSLVDERLIRRAHKRGHFVGTWTVNDVGEALELARAGVDVLIGDDPGQILRAVERKS